MKMSTKSPKAHKKLNKSLKKKVAKNSNPIHAQAAAQIATTTTLSKKSTSATTAAPSQMKKSFTDAINTGIQDQINALPSTLTQQERTHIIARMQLRFAKKWLTRRGLYWEDMFEDYAHVRACIYMLPADVRTDRFRRWLRALDLDLKFKELPDDMQQYDPFVSYGLDDALTKYKVFLCEDANYV